jgi:hypothetical protein
MQLLAKFEEVFAGQQYRHRDSTIGDKLCFFVFEDLYSLGRSASLVRGVENRDVVANTANRVTGKPSRRGDGTLGERVVSQDFRVKKKFDVARGSTADVRIGVEVKLPSAAKIKQIGRVINDLRDQADQFRDVTSDAISLAIVGVNHAEAYRSYEGERFYDKPGRTGPAPADEAEETIRRLIDGSSRGAASAYDEFLILDFVATNRAPYPFAWVDRKRAADEYAAALQRISSLYEKRF